MVSQFKSILDLVSAFSTEQDCILHIEKLRWNGSVKSPFAEGSQVYACKGHKYKCKESGKYFNVKTGTIFDNTKIPLIKWFMALYIFSSHKKGVSSHQLARDITVTQKTAWFMLHRLRYAFDHPAFSKTTNLTTEIDETYIGGNETNKHENKKTLDSAGRSTKVKKAVLGMKQRGGNVIARVVEDANGKTLLPIIFNSIPEKTIIVTDEYRAYNSLKKNYYHFTSNHTAKQYVNGMAHTNGIENFWSHLKRGIDGIYHSVSKEHLQAYVNEFSLRYNTRTHSTADRFNSILSNVSGRRLTYETLITHD